MLYIPPKLQIVGLTTFMTAEGNSKANHSWSKTLKTTLFLISSIALGGLAVAFSNRRELIQMQNQRPDPVTDSLTPSEDAEKVAEEVY